MTMLADLFSLDDRVALVTGAASGFGAHFAGTLAKAGASVVCLARRADRIEEIAEHIRATGGKAIAFAADVTDGDAVEKAYDAAEAAFGTVDILVNSAGTSSPALLQDTTEEQWSRIMDVSLRAVWQVSRVAARRLAAADKPGNIVNIASILAGLTKPGFGPYGVAKAGVVQLTRAMALDFMDLGIRANAIAPGYFSTEMTAWFFETEQGRREIELLPSHRLGEIAELDGALLLLAGRASSYMTGSVITVDGGHSVRLS
jgi:NAD(P)-dependent dehydrogenase (short-subunit alcohol dehydrogenase family)